MNKHELLHELIKVQDIVRQVWVEQDTPELAKIVRELDKHMTQVINQLGEPMETLTITWSWEDVRDRFADMNEDEEDYQELSKEFCCKVIKYLDRHHDCNFGITWEHIDAAIEDHLSEQREEN